MRTGDGEPDSPENDDGHDLRKNDGGESHRIRHLQASPVRAITPISG